MNDYKPVAQQVDSIEPTLETSSNISGGRAYESTFRMAFIKALYNEGKGIAVSAEVIMNIE